MSKLSNLVSDDRKKEYRRLSKGELVAALILDLKYIWAIGGAVYALTVAVGVAAPPWAYLEWMGSGDAKVAIAALILVGLLLHVPIRSGIKRIWSPPRVYVIRVNVTETPPINVYAGHPDLWEEVDVVSGEPASYGIGDTMMYVVTDFTRVSEVSAEDEIYDHLPRDEDGDPAVSGIVSAGSWLGEASDAEIVHRQEEIEGNRRRNNIWARIGEKIYARSEKIAERVERRHHKEMTDKSMDMSLYEGGQDVKGVLRDEVPELEQVDDSKSVPDIVEDEVQRQIQEINTADDRSMPPGTDQ